MQISRADPRLNQAPTSAPSSLDDPDEVRSMKSDLMNQMMTRSPIAYHRSAAAAAAGQYRNSLPIVKSISRSAERSFGQFLYRFYL